MLLLLHLSDHDPTTMCSSHCPVQNNRRCPFLPFSCSFSLLWLVQKKTRWWVCFYSFHACFFSFFLFILFLLFLLHASSSHFHLSLSLSSSVQFCRDEIKSMKSMRSPLHGAVWQRSQAPLRRPRQGLQNARRPRGPARFRRTRGTPSAAAGAEGVPAGPRLIWNIFCQSSLTMRPHQG